MHTQDCTTPFLPPHLPRHKTPAQTTHFLQSHLSAYPNPKLQSPVHCNLDQRLKNLNVGNFLPCINKTALLASLGKYPHPHLLLQNPHCRPTYHPPEAPTYTTPPLTTHYAPPPIPPPSQPAQAN